MAASATRLASRRLLDTAVFLLALFAGINCVLGAIAPRLDANWLWLRGGALPAPLLQVVLVAFCLAVLFGQWLHTRGRQLARVLAAALAVACLADAIVFYGLVTKGSIQTALPIPLSLLIGLLLLVWSLLTAPPPRTRLSTSRRLLWQEVARSALPVAIAAAAVLSHLLSYGATDYRRPADAAVVLGAAVWADGSPSTALLDRTRTACELYHAGLVDHLVLSGGRDPRAPISEPACMRRIALECGVPDTALLLDEAGRTTSATVRAAASLARRHAWNKLLFVSHDYHLARIKLDAVRRGLRAYTVPARESRRLRKKPYFVAREVAAFAWYFARGDA